MSEKQKTDELKSSGQSLCKLAEVELNGLKNQGLEPTWEQVVRINDLCRKVEKPTIPSPSATGKPVLFKDRVFWPFTIQAAEWYTFALSNLETDEALAALLYSLEHGREPEHFITLYDVRKTKALITKYKRTLDLTLNECIDIIGSMSGEEESLEGENKDSADMDQLIAYLTTQTGLPAEYWQCRVCLDHAVRSVELIKQSQSETKLPNSEYVKAERALGAYLIKVKKNGK